MATRFRSAHHQAFILLFLSIWSINAEFPSLRALRETPSHQSIRHPVRCDSCEPWTCPSTLHMSGDPWRSRGDKDTELEHLCGCHEPL